MRGARDRARDVYTQKNFISAESYNSSVVLQLDKERKWPKVWQMVCRVEEVSNVGDFVNYMIFDESILVD